MHLDLNERLVHNHTPRALQRNDICLEAKYEDNGFDSFASCDRLIVQKISFIKHHALCCSFITSTTPK